MNSPLPYDPPQTGQHTAQHQAGSGHGTPFSIARTSLTTKYIIVTDWSGSPNKAEMNNLNSGALLLCKY